jgi:HlyD family secretion protein
MDTNPQKSFGKQRKHFSSATQKRRFFWSITLAAVIAGCGGNSPSAPAPNSGQGGQRGGRGSGSSEVAVRTTTVQRISIQREVELSGNLVSPEQAKVSSEVAGVVKDANIELGQEVKAGQILVQLDTRELDLALERAQSALRQTEAQLGIDNSRSSEVPPDEEIASVRTAIANRDDTKAQFTRAQELVNKGLMPRADLDSTQTRLKVTEAILQSSLENVRSLKASLQDRRASVQLAQKKINDASVRAPVAGAVSEKLVQRGEYIRENSQVVTIVQLNPLQLRTAVQEKFSNVIRPSLSVKFEVAPFPGQTFIGRIANISPSIDQQTRTFAVEILVDNSNRKLKPGFFAKGTILTDIDNNVMALPEDALSILAGVSSVFLVENGVIRQQSVTVGAHQGTFYEIVDGLKGNEILAVTNLNQLVTGTKVKTAGDSSTARGAEKSADSQTGPDKAEASVAGPSEGGGNHTGTGGRRGGSR